MSIHPSSAISVLGIDPGSNITGWGIVRECSGRLELVANGVLRVKGDSFPERLACIYHGLHGIIEEFHPEEAGVEQVFTAKNIASTIKLAQARGAAIAACASFHLAVQDYEPTLVKKTLVGTGRAEKEQVAFMVARLLGKTHIEGPLDSTDALAIAVCHLTLRRFRRLEGLS
ncbi:crossover junction endodeoxyribonuclease RuvC [Mailhella massiliensis]|uniref:Crossover junction endodeoxyribonuclease RuvC n=1 Tax=Mailhella massiliensis TaxID=1903261 RepID=A0A921AWQ9_9BACT|nr:crossover junction endodeoxyribonuclease RuvC [Mailhella massiliensis]HJD97285.1 crossover junction endodeoxyribonuclease RuvC [Mailhella massiliensis]